MYALVYRGVPVQSHLRVKILCCASSGATITLHFVISLKQSVKIFSIVMIVSRTAHEHAHIVSRCPWFSISFCFTGGQTCCAMGRNTLLY